jgi:hypothetical protein
MCAIRKEKVMVLQKQNTKSYISAGRYIPSAALVAMIIFCLVSAMSAKASQPNLPPNGNFTSIAAAPFGGFWVQADDGSRTGTYAIDGAPQFPTVAVVGSIAAIPAASPSAQGYWVVAPNGDIYNRGAATELCGGKLANCTGFRYSSTRYITAAAASPKGTGLWAVDNQGAVWTAGDVPALGDVTHEVHPPTAIASTPSGEGYYILISDGGVYSFGDAEFRGSTGGNRPGGHDLTGIALSYDRLGNVNGYWLVGSDGGIHAFGDAAFLGSTGGGPGRGAVSNIVSRPGGRSYAWVYKDGRVELSRTVPVVTLSSAKSTDTVLSVLGGGTQPGTPLTLAPPDETASQLWDLYPTSQDGELVQLVNANSGLCADAEGESANARIILWPCKGNDQGWDNQRWRLVETASGLTSLQSILHPDSWIFGEYSATGSTVQLIPASQVVDPLTIEWTITQVR